MPDPAFPDALASSADFAPNFEDVLRRLAEKFDGHVARSPEKFRFSFDGLDFDVRRVGGADGHRFLVTAAIGYLPYTIESAERREAIKAIIIASRGLPTVRFGVDVSTKISAGAFYDLPEVVLPDSIFYPLTLFMQEARPFISLIGKYLSPSGTAQHPEKA